MHCSENEGGDEDKKRSNLLLFLSTVNKAFLRILARRKTQLTTQLEITQRGSNNRSLSRHLHISSPSLPGLSAVQQGSWQVRVKKVSRKGDTISDRNQTLTRLSLILVRTWRADLSLAGRKASTRSRRHNKRHHSIIVRFC